MQEQNIIKRKNINLDDEPRRLKKRSDEIQKEFELILKKANYPYLSKVSVQRKRFFSNKRDRPQKNQTIAHSLDNKSEPKNRPRYILKGNSIDQSLEYPANQSISLEDKQKNSTNKFAMPTSVKNSSNTNNRSYFLKKLKQRYHNKSIHNNADKSDIKLGLFEKHRTRATEESLQKQLLKEFDDDSIQLTNLNKIVSGFQVKETHADKLSDFEKIQILNFKEVYYYGQQCVDKTRNGLENNTFDDDQGGYLWRERDHVSYRFQMLAMLGQGSFGQVFKCYDHKQKQQVALKMVRNKKKYNKQAQTQISILRYIKHHDPNMNKNLTQIKQDFIFREHTCMLFELLSINLYELIRLNDYYGLPLDLIRRFSLQLLNGMHFLHKHDIIHADLKPENVLLKHPNKSGLKIIDFGSSCFIRNRIYTYIQSRYYRAPEVILGVPYDFKIDVWSFACIIAELYLGYPILPGENEKQQMAMIMELIGLPSRRLLEESTRRHHYFNDKFQPLEFQNSKGKSFVPLANPLGKVIEQKDASFKNFLQKCFVWQPEQRLTALECLKHDWIIQGLPEDIKKQHLKFIDQQEQALRIEKRKRSPKLKEMKIQQMSPPKSKYHFTIPHSSAQTIQPKRFPSIEYKRRFNVYKQSD